MPIGYNNPFSRNDAPGKANETASAKKAEAPKIQWVASTPKYQLTDLLLPEDTRNDLLDIISYSQNRQLLFHDWGLGEKYASRDILAVNLYGAPGTGKTMAAHAIANALNMPLICVDYAEIESKYVGETSKNLTSLFRTAVEDHAAIFFDEADALLSKRVTNMTSAVDVSVNQTRSVLLTLLNDYRGVILFATNFIQNFDPAFLRRIRYHILFRLPDKTLRESLWRLYIPEKMPHDADLSSLAEKFGGVSGSDIANAVFSAATSAARDGAKIVKQTYFEKAIQNCIDAKRANEGEPSTTVQKRILSNEEAKKLHLEKETEI